MAAGTTIHLVRHGDVDNPDKVYYGRLPGFGLNAEGREQARAAGRYLSNRPITIIYASPQKRAQETARIIQAAIEPEPRFCDEEAINEIYSQYDGVSQHEMDGINWNFYDRARPPYEQPADVFGRVSEFVQRMRREHRGEEVVAVSHADPIVFYWMWILGIPLRADKRRLLHEHGLLDDYPAKASISSFHFETFRADERPTYRYIRPY